MRRVAIATAIGFALAAVIGFAVDGELAGAFRIAVWSLGCLYVLLGASGGSPSMDRAIGQESRMLVGPLMGRTDESYRGPKVSTSAVFAFSGILLFALGVALDR
ncbi:MAG: hypothetical protein H0V94_06095 [Actinobacteria bacterium]|nr:hypothetical protein [Actinomycetota bacterium]